MRRGVDRAAHLGDARSHTGRRFAVYDAQRLDAFIGVAAQALFNRVRIGAVAPVTGDEVDIQAELGGHLLPEGGEVPGLVHKHAVAGRERVDERRLPGAGAGGRVDHDLAARGLEHALHIGKHFLAERTEFRAAVVDGREIDRPQDAIGDVRRSRYLQEVPAGTAGHWVILTAASMNAPSIPVKFARANASALAERLRRECDAEVLFDRASRGRYATDASIYQVEPIGIVVPRTEEAARVAIAIAAQEGVPILPRGAGSSQCGQRSEEHTSELQSRRDLVCRLLLEKKKKKKKK